MCFGVMQANKANTKLAKNLVIYTLKMANHYSDEMIEYYSHQW
jgi:hypothetical protein